MTTTEPSSIPSLASLHTLLHECMAVDRFALTRTLRGVDPSGSAEKFSALVGRIEASHLRYCERRDSRPQISYDPALPVARERDSVAQAIDANQVVIICGETGSGKTTQLPKICLELGRGTRGLIAHTQPRRIAARTVAARIASELSTPLGELVGYQVRFVEQFSERSLVKVMTDGVLLAELARDRFLNAYDTIIIDEAHERTLNIDFILGYLQRLVRQRPDLKVIVTSATIDPERFSKHFGGAPIVEVSGRGYPVEVRYRPPGAESEDINTCIVDAVREAGRVNRGDVLVFLPGEREIRDAANTLRRQGFEDTDILPLYARLSLNQQAAIFRTSGRRRIVLATNVAETSVTVPNIRFVVDTGVARISRYSFRSKVQGLPVESVSQASADQRKGRCGRIAPGVCFRLYGEEEFASREAFTEPEIRRTNLAAVILQMKALKLGAPDAFPFIDPPDKRFVRDAYRELRELGAVDAQESLTLIGRRLARLPLDPRLGRMLLAADEEGCVGEVLTITAALSINDPRERPMEAREAADRAHRRFRDKRSDFMSWLNLWRFFREQAGECTRSQLKTVCVDHFLNHARLREWADVRRQLAGLCAQMDIRPGGVQASYEAVHRALLAGLLTQVGTRHDEGGYRGTRGSRFHIFPGSSVTGEGPAWVVAGSLLSTRRLYAHQVARIEPAWIEALAGDLAVRKYHDVRWQARRGEVVATEHVSFFGLQLVTNRTVAFARIDQAGARDVFIRQALMRNRLRRPPAFLRHNVALLEDLEKLEDRLRRADLMVDESWLFAFYDERIGPGIVNEKRLGRWLAKAPKPSVKALELTREQLLAEGDMASQVEQFPGKMLVADHALPLSYRFEPGHEADGVTTTVPLAVLNQLPDGPFEWLVPGMFLERVVALLRSLPKRFRRSLVPLPDFARACLESVDYGHGDVLTVLGVELERMAGVTVSTDAWRLDTLAPHLRMRFVIVDEAGEVLAASRDLARLKADLGEESQNSFGEMLRDGGTIERRTKWDFGDLPEKTHWDNAGVELVGFPGLVDEGSTVAVRVFQDLAARDEAHAAGLVRLCLLRGGRGLKSLTRWLAKETGVALMYASAEAAQPDYCALAPRQDVGPAKELEEDAIAWALNLALSESEESIVDEKTFSHRADTAIAKAGAFSAELQTHLQDIVAAHSHYFGIAAKVDGPGRIDATRDVHAQLQRLVHRRFLSVTPPSKMGDIARFIRAAARRLEKLDRDARTDSARLSEVLGVEEPVFKRIRSAGRYWRRNSALVEVRWMLEELRVSVFAQDLGTRQSVSVKRITRALDAIG